MPRSALTVPGGSERMLAKARGLEADELVLDLEDAVPADRKAEARGMVVEALAAGGWAAESVAVRVNPIGSEWFEADLAAVAGRVGSIVVPKVEGPLSDLGVPVQALIETALGLERLASIAGSAVEALILGYADLASSLSRPAGGALELWLPVQNAVLVAARAHGLRAIDGPHLDIAADDAFRAAARRARDLGFDGKWAIHPGQLADLNAIFTPSEEEVAHARAVIEALDRGEGAVALDGAMVDEAMRAGALRTLERAR
jgi:citrate lyase subunit beta/citryl-CoA lyase